MIFRRKQVEPPLAPPAPGIDPMAEPILMESAEALPEPILMESAEALPEPLLEPLPEPLPEALPESAPEPASELARLREERTALISLCLYARDRVSSKAAADRIDARLAEIGITTVRPDGEAFDPAQHEAAASAPTDDPALHNTVAETELPGYSDRGEAIRPPVVTVYQQTAKDQSGPDQ